MDRLLLSTTYLPDMTTASAADAPLRFRFKFPAELSEGGVILRPLSVEHAPAIHAAFSQHPHVYSLWCDQPYAMDEQRWVSSINADRENDGLLRWAILVEEGDSLTLAGMIGVRTFSARDTACSHGLYVFKPWQRTGVTAQACYAFFKWVFEDLGVRRLERGSSGRNMASHHSGLRTGFKLEITRRYNFVLQEGLPGHPLPPYSAFGTPDAGKADDQIVSVMTSQMWENGAGERMRQLASLPLLPKKKVADSGEALLDPEAYRQNKKPMIDLKTLVMPTWQLGHGHGWRLVPFDAQKHKEHLVKSLFQAGDAFERFFAVEARSEAVISQAIDELLCTPIKQHAFAIINAADACHGIICAAIFVNQLTCRLSCLSAASAPDSHIDDQAVQAMLTWLMEPADRDGLDIRRVEMRCADYDTAATMAALRRGFVYVGDEEARICVDPALPHLGRPLPKGAVLGSPAKGNTADEHVFALTFADYRDRTAERVTHKRV